MATTPQAKRVVLFSGVVVTSLTALDYSATKGGIVPMKVVVGGLLATSLLLAVSDPVPNLAFGLATTALIAAIVVPGPSGQSRVELFRRIGGKL